MTTLTFTTTLTSSPGWRWMPGMRCKVMGIDPSWHRIIGIAPDPIHGRIAALGCWNDDADDDPHAVGVIYRTEPLIRLHSPDLTDPATVGCLAALARELHDTDSILPVADQSTEGHAWAAVIAAWRP